MVKALVVYSSRTGDTKKIGDLIAEGMRFSMVDVTLMEAKDIKDQVDLEGYDAYLFGSSTYHGEMMNSMKTALFIAEKAALEGKKAGTFGAFGWSGEAAERIFDTMKNIYKMDMATSPLMLKSADVEGGIKIAQNYGKDLVAGLE